MANQFTSPQGAIFSDLKTLKERKLGFPTMRNVKMEMNTRRYDHLNVGTCQSYLSKLPESFFRITLPNVYTFE